MFLATLASLRWSWLLAAVALVIGTYAGRALRWGVLIEPVAPQAKLGRLFSATVIGFTAIGILGRPGEFVRPYLIARQEKVSLSSQLAALLLERIFDLLMALLLFGFALSRVRHSEVKAGAALAWVLTAGGWVAAGTGALCLIILILIRRYSEAMRKRILGALGFLPERHLARVEPLVNAFVQGVASMRSRRSLLLASAYTILEWAVIVLSNLCILRAYGGLLDFGLVDVLIFVGFLAFGAVVQIPGVGGGIQVVAILVLTELFHVPLELAASIAMVLWIISFVVIIPLGLVLALREGLNWTRLRELDREVAP